MKEQLCIAAGGTTETLRRRDMRPAYLKLFIKKQHMDLNLGLQFVIYAPILVLAILIREVPN